MSPSFPTAAIRVGTASWSEPEFVKAGCYPKGLAAGQRLPFYAQFFDYVELNSSFYAIPAASMCEKWVRETPDDFLFDAKVHRLLSRHATKADALPKDLQDQLELNDRENVILTPGPRGGSRGPVPRSLGSLGEGGPAWRAPFANDARLRPTLVGPDGAGTAASPAEGPGKDSRRVVLELRHHDWLDGRHREETTAFLKEQGVTLASIDGPPADRKHFTIMPAVDLITDPRLAYLRLHGRDPKAYLTGKTVAERFHYDYGDDELGEVAERAHQLATETDEVHVVFNNNSRDFAPKAAERLRQRLRQITPKKTGPLHQGNLFEFTLIPIN